MDEILNHALLYAGRFGWHVFPVHGIQADGSCTCGNAACDRQGKHPVTQHGLKQASADEGAIRALWGTRTGLNVAVRTGAESGIWVLDIDTGGEDSLRALEARHGSLPLTLQHFTGNGRHLVFRHPCGGVRIKNSVRKMGAGLDVRGDGGYIVAAPSRHVSGRAYRWADLDIPIAEAPQWLLDMVIAQPDVPAPAVGPVDVRDMPELTDSDVADMLSHLSPDMPYDDWLAVGFALHQGGYRFEAWDAWSANGSKYRSRADCWSHWRSFKSRGPGGTITMGTLVHMAMGHGWTPPQREGLSPSDQAMVERIARNTRARLVAEQQEPAAPAPAVVAPPPLVQRLANPLGFDPVDLPGVIGDTTRWICATAIKPQPELALLNTLAVAGAVFGRRYASPIDTRTNVYTVGLAPTAAGKDHSRKQMGKLLNAAGLADFLGPDELISDRGTLRGLEEFPAVCAQLDEFGHVLKSISDPKAPSYLRGISKVLMQLYSSSSGFYKGGTYASNMAKPIAINAPHLCIYGTTTSETYAEAITKGAVKDGSLNRFIVVPSACGYPPRRRGTIDMAVPDKLAASWAAFAPPRRQTSTLGETPLTVQWGSCERRIDDLGDMEDDRMRQGGGTAPLWGRFRENVIKIAMVLAIARNPEYPVMSDSDLDVAVGLVGYSVAMMEELVENSVAESDFDALCNRALEACREGDGATRSALLRRLRCKSRELTEVMATLVEQERVVAEKVRNSTVFKPA